jgi:hypothetical protein
MATKSTAKKQPFIIKPLNWVAPEAARDEPEKRPEEAKQPAPAKETQD